MIHRELEPGCNVGAEPHRELELWIVTKLPGTTAALHPPYALLRVRIGRRRVSSVQ